jgi:hypothetical protein
MNNTKHTPGPWKACRAHEEFEGPMWELDEGDDYASRPVTRILASLGTVAAAHDLFEFTEGNAALIAAAPELLDLLEWAISTLEKRGIEGLAQRLLVAMSRNLLARLGVGVKS